MKTIFLVRHAKSSWESPALEDFDRPLNRRGKQDAPKMGGRLKDKNIMPDLLISSPAKRTLKTARKMAKAMGYPKKKISFIDSLYHASSREFFLVIQGISSSVDTLMVVGHNPGLTDFANAICERGIDNIVTAGIYAVQLSVDDWKEIKNGSKGRLLFYEYPKKAGKKFK